MGPMTKDVEDCALMMNVIAGHDPLDSTSLDLPVPDYTTFLNRPIKGIRVGIPKEFFGKGIHPEVADSVSKAIKKLSELGALVSEVSLPNSEYSRPRGGLIESGPI
jgi:aspartyl-tRNA(Asn)/glutamyl-tRNA(Gln) amidotransferase subunit A